MFSTIVESQPKAAYSAVVSCFKNTLCYIVRTIPDNNELLVPIEDIIRNQFMSAITGSRICSEEEHKLLSLATRYEGVTTLIFNEQTDVVYNNSWRITTDLTTLIKGNIRNIRYENLR